MSHDPATCRNGDHYGSCSGATIAAVWADEYTYSGLPRRAPVVPDDDQRCMSCGHLPGCPCPHDCEPESDGVTCKRCGHGMFRVAYDPKAQGMHVECGSCGEVAFL